MMRIGCGRSFSSKIHGGGLKSSEKDEMKI
jgi:hypothetical protein